MEAMQLVSTCSRSVPNLFSEEERRERNIFTLFAYEGNEREILSALPTNMDILFSRVGEFTLVEFKINSQCFYSMTYWKNCCHTSGDNTIGRRTRPSADTSPYLHQDVGYGTDPLKDHPEGFHHPRTPWTCKQQKGKSPRKGR